MKKFVLAIVLVFGLAAVASAGDCASGQCLAQKTKSALVKVTEPVRPVVKKSVTVTKKVVKVRVLRVRRWR